MRPQDVLVLLKLSTMKGINWRFQDIAVSLQLSASEVSESLNRSLLARLVSGDKRKIYYQSFLEFLIYGLKYVFPVLPGSMVRGIATAHSAPPLNKIILTQTDHYVWASSEGNIRGQAIAPLYQSVDKIVKSDAELYELLALVDVIRVGRAREVKIAIEELTIRLKDK
ncbi:MAG: hypothetical protein GZ094_00300 [Mariniphaga sp.]|nr:hypothetical protein [Mariniphaga sp.]